MFLVFVVFLFNLRPYIFKHYKGQTFPLLKLPSSTFSFLQDKEAVLRKSKLLRGSNILVTEDFPRRVREHRAELLRFAKEVKYFLTFYFWKYFWDQIKRNEPESRMHLQWDKLFINNEVFVYSEETGSVELETESHCNVSSLLFSSWFYAAMRIKIH